MAFVPMATVERGILTKIRKQELNHLVSENILPIKSIIKNLPRKLTIKNNKEVVIKLIIINLIKTAVFMISLSNIADYYTEKI